MRVSSQTLFPRPLGDVITLSDVQHEPERMPLEVSQGLKYLVQVVTRHQADWHCQMVVSAKAQTFL